MNPRPCPAGDACVAGHTSARAWLHDLVQLTLMTGSAAQRPDRDLHPWLEDLSLRPDGHPTPDAVDLTTGLAGREPGSLGHDGSDRFQATQKIIRAAGLDPDTWGICPACGGHGVHPDDVPPEERA